MSYSDITVNDPNFIKRYLQRSRFRDAVALLPANHDGMTVLDFGGGDGELCLQLAMQDLTATFICYEPADTMYKEAETKTAGNKRIILQSSLESIAPASIDVVYCLEVFEHLPEKELIEAIESIFSLLKPNGTLIIGVPNELFLAALYKGIFRIMRRWGAFDTRPLNIMKCIIGNPPRNRPQAEIAPGKQYHFYHLGFDYRLLGEAINKRFAASKTVYSPFRFISGWASPEIYYIANKGK